MHDCKATATVTGGFATHPATDKWLTVNSNSDPWGLSLTTGLRVTVP
jgi:hypothetical protein